jgi:hypothetical protein
VNNNNNSNDDTDKGNTMNIYYSKDINMHWLEIDKSTVRIPFNGEPDMEYSNVTLMNHGTISVSLWEDKAIQFKELWENKDNNDN